MRTLLFVYGTLKRGGSNHRHLVGQEFVGTACTVPGWRLFDLGGYPGIAAVATEPNGVTGEVWSVDAAALQHLDEFEGVHQSLYRRAPITLQPPFADQPVDAYFPALPIAGRREIGTTWTE